MVTLAAMHAHALLGSVATARSLDEAATQHIGALPDLVLEVSRARERLWLETHAGGDVVPVLLPADRAAGPAGLAGHGPGRPTPPGRPWSTRRCAPRAAPTRSPASATGGRWTRSCGTCCGSARCRWR